MSIEQAVIATHRFGLGPKPGELEAVNTDPKGWLLGQLSTSTTVPFRPSAEVLSLQVQSRQARAQQNEELSQQLGRQLRGATLSDSGARTRNAITTNMPFAERLVHFWSNHFALSIDKAAVIGMGGSFEGEAIRPNIFGRFEDLLLASTKHPGMLLYLDNAQSIGPDSRAARRGNRGLNENLAREILELHTLGVDGGYSQSDVTNFAKIITGWSVAGGPGDVLAARQGSFAFNELAHEPGSQKLLDKTYAEAGLAQGEAALRDLAVHPKTAAHIAFKLARHFIADEPPSAAVDSLTKSFISSGGDLPTLYKTLIDLDLAWIEKRQKYLTPNEWIIALLRGSGGGGTRQGAGAQLRDNQLMLGFDTLGQPVWRPGSPAGWADTADFWTSPDSLGKRIEWANALANRLGSGLAATELLNTLYGTAVNPDLIKAVRSAESNSQALVLVAMAPDSLRR